MSQKHENMAGGISYRTLDSINPSEIFKYLDGVDENSSNEILIKIKDYYLASADKIEFRILLARKRVEVGFLDPGKSEMVDAKISESLKWLEDLKTAILKQRSTRKFLGPQLYKQWHVIKLVPSAVEGLLLTSLIKINVDCYDGENQELSPKIGSLTASSEKIFIKILDLTEKSDLEHTEKMKIDTYNKIGKTGNLLSKYKKIQY